MTKDTLTTPDTLAPEQAGGGSPPARGSRWRIGHLASRLAGTNPRGLLRRDRLMVVGGVLLALGGWLLWSLLAEEEAGPALADDNVTAPVSSPTAEGLAESRELEVQILGEAAPSPIEIRPTLTIEECLILGRTAYEQGRLSDAQDLLGQGLLLYSENLELRAAVCEAMALVCDSTLQPAVAALYRERAAELLARMSRGAEGLLSLAQDDMQRGLHREARRKLHRVILGGGQGDAISPSMTADAAGLLASAFEAEYRAGLLGAPLDRIPEPELFVEEIR
jgi:hypothetical protein